MPRFRIVSEDGISLDVIDTATGDKLKTHRVEVAGEPGALVVTLQFIADEDFALDIAAGEMDTEPADDVTPPKPRTLS